MTIARIPSAGTPSAQLPSATIPSPYSWGTAARTHNPCLAVQPHGPGELFPGICDFARGHEGPHCTKRYWHTVGWVQATAWVEQGGAA